MLGAEGVFSIRPEKIRIASPAAEPANNEHHVDGTVAEVIYVGDATRYVVDIDPGGRLVALSQNATTSSSQALEKRGERVRLMWDREYEYKVHG